MNKKSRTDLSARLFLFCQSASSRIGVEYQHSAVSLQTVEASAVEFITELTGLSTRRWSGRRMGHRLVQR